MLPEDARYPCRAISVCELRADRVTSLAEKDSIDNDCRQSLPRLVYTTMFWTLALLSELCATVIGSQLPLRKHEVEDASSLMSNIGRRQEPTVAITGIQTYGVQPRLEIRQLEARPDQWNIFLLGLRRFQQTDQSNLTSYYQIAGIHGRPYNAWDGVPSAPGQDSPGYCTHVRKQSLGASL